jgi:predicted CoA-binding protein
MRLTNNRRRSNMLNKTIKELKDEGYAVVLFNPEELEGAESDRVEDRLIELGWEVIFDLKPNEQEEL